MLAERSYSSDLDTAYEWLANDRVLSEPEKHDEISWFCPSTSMHSAASHVDGGSGEDEDDEAGIKMMPLYPLRAVHIPHSGQNFTIINIESKNVQMTRDLVNGKWGNSLFCASLRARDTSRIASVGTVMHLIDTEDRSISGARVWPGNILPTINRVVANCRAVGVVDIISIEEQDYNDEDYLVAKVRLRKLPIESKSGSYATTESEKLIGNYNKVKSTYIDSQSLASNELPKFARNAIKTLPTFNTEDVVDVRKFWTVVETWQMLCNTIRQSKQTRLQNIINELSVSVAMKSKGPLELPVKRKTLPLNIQRQLEEMERSAAQDFIELGMDPILNFQEILAIKGHWDRVEKLAWMVQIECRRLEAKESLIQALLKEDL
ncbi:hypothetical protein ACHAWF_011903 [Thalassiosira exigua]